MQFADFLGSVSKQDFFTNRTVLGFKGQEYSLLFFSLLMQKMHTVHDIQVQTLSVQEAELSSIKSQLSMSFLGINQMFWLGNLADLDEKKKRAWLAYISTYTGPHMLVFFLDEADGTKIDFVDLPPVMNETLYQALQLFFKPDLAGKSKQFNKKLFADYDKMSLDTTCMILEYQTVVGTGTQEFIDEWLPKIVASDKSLFTLSQYFFSKSSTSFMKLWHDVRAEYPDVFWVTFWSEQIWRAYYVAKLYQEKKIVDAKKISYRLPFSFLQRDWRKSTLTELRNAHDYVYNLDYALKNGSGENGLDLFFTKFFSKQFDR